MFKFREHNRGERVVGGGWGQMVEVMYCGGEEKELMAAGDGETSQRKVMRFVYSTSFSTCSSTSSALPATRWKVG